MKKIMFVISIWIFFFQNSFAQVSTFSTLYKYPNNYSVFFDAIEINNKYYSVGSLLNASTFTFDGYLAGADLNGNKLFSKYQREVDSVSNFLTFYGIQYLSGYLYASGYVAHIDSSFTKGFTQDPILVKYDTLGNVIWYRNDYRTANRYFYNSSDLKLVGNNLIHVGSTVFQNNQNVNTSQNTVIIWMDTTGNVIRQKEYNLSTADKFEVGDDYQPLADNGFLMTGLFTNSGGGSKQNGFLMRADSLGNKIWHRSYGQTGRLERFYSTTVLADGNYLSCGWRARDEDLTGVNGAWDAWLVKVNPLNGDTIWTKTVNAAFFNRFVRAFEQPNGDFIIGGAGGNADSANTDAQIMRLDANGNKLWVKRYGWPYDLLTFNTSAENIYEFKKTSDGGYLIAGDARDYNSSDPKQAAWLLKVDSNGCLVSGCGSVGLVEYEVFSTLTLKAYPNPAQEQIKINGELQDDDVLTLYDFTGKILQQQTLNGYDVPEMNVSEYANGIYLLSLYRNGYDKVTQKVVVAR